MKIVPTFALAGLAGLAAIPAQANWENTLWGNTIEQVIAKAGDGTSRIAAGPERKVLAGQTLLAKRSGQWRAIQSVQEFYFDRQGRLGMVRFAPTNWRDCDNFRTELVASLGKPDKMSSSSGGPFQYLKHYEWANKSKNRYVVLVESRRTTGASADRTQGCTATYQPFSAERLKIGK